MRRKLNVFSPALLLSCSLPAMAAAALKSMAIIMVLVGLAVGQAHSQTYPSCSGKRIISANGTFSSVFSPTNTTIVLYPDQSVTLSATPSDYDEYDDPFTCSVTGGFSYDWKVDGSTMANVSSYTFSTSTPKSYSVVCTVDDPASPSLGNDANRPSQSWTVNVIKRPEWVPEPQYNLTPWGGITAGPGSNFCLTGGASVTLTCAQLTDKDTKKTYSVDGSYQEAEFDDELDYKWEISYTKRSGESVTVTLHGQSVNWTVPEVSCSSVSITCSVTDKAKKGEGETGSRDDTDPDAVSISGKVFAKGAKEWQVGDQGTLEFNGGPTMCKEGESLTLYATATDTDTWTACGSQTNEVSDSFKNWRWTVDGPGSICPAGDGSAIYTGPLPGTISGDTQVTVTVSVDDVAFKGINDLGTRDDTISPATTSFTLTQQKRQWSPSPAMVPLVTSPSGGTTVHAGQKVTCSALAIDNDTWTLGTVQGTTSDVIISYTWYASGGEFLDGKNTGQSVTWIPPSTPGNVNIYVQAEDLGLMPEGDTEVSRKDGSVSSQAVTVNVAPRNWTTPTEIDVKLPNPSTSGKVKAGEKVYFGAEASDEDTWTQGSNSEKEADSITRYTWSGGTFEGSGASVSWIAPAVTADTDYTIAVEVDDQGTKSDTDTGTRNDTAKSASTTIRVLKDGTREWDADTPATVTITSPANGDLIRGGDGAQALSLSASATDDDHWRFTDDSDQGYTDDGVDVTWTVNGQQLTGGSWDPGSCNGTVSICATGKDKAVVPTGDTGTRDDDDATDTISVEVDAENPIVTVEVPEATGSWIPARFKVSVTASDTYGIDSISCDPPGYSQLVGSDGSNSVVACFDVVAESDGPITINGAATDRVGHVGSGSVVVQVDATPPSSSASAPSTSGNTSFEVTWSGSDEASGVKDYDVQVKVEDPEGNSGSWQGWISGTTEQSAVYEGMEGYTYYFRSRARDNAGNEEDYEDAADTQCTVHDTEPPCSQVNSLPDRVTTATFTVTWTGTDEPNPGGSGISCYDVEFGNGQGQWIPWINGTTETSASFNGYVGGTFYFRCRAHDNAGNVESYNYTSFGDAHCTVVGSGGGGTPSLSITASGDYIVPGCPLNTVDYTVGSSGSSDVSFEVVNSYGWSVRCESLGGKSAGSYRYQWDGRDGDGYLLDEYGSPYRIRMCATLGTVSSEWSYQDDRKVEGWQLAAVIGDQAVNSETLVSGVDASTINFNTFSVMGTYADSGVTPESVAIAGVEADVEDPDGPVGNTWNANVWLDAMFYTTPSTPVDIRYQLRLEEAGDLIRDFVMNPWDMDPSDNDLDKVGILTFGIDSADGEATLRDLEEDYQPGE